MVCQVRVYGMSNRNLWYVKNEFRVCQVRVYTIPSRGLEYVNKNQNREVRHWLMKYKMPK